ncbi:unnamed protein product, partial [Sphacelaria rigidula]
GRWAALFFAAYMLLCATMMFDVLVGVVVEGFRVSTRGPEDEQQPATEDRAPLHPETIAENESDGNWSGTNISSTALPGASTVSGGARTGPMFRAPVRGLSRRGSSRKYSQVRAEDMFRSYPKVELSAVDLRELEQAVEAVEKRLHKAWYE